VWRLNSSPKRQERVLWLSYMIFFLILGAILGAVSILFILQNVTPVTVSFFAYHLNGSLALVLFVAMFSGIVVTILMLLPGFVSDEFKVMRLKKQVKELEDELFTAKQSLHQAATGPTAASDNTTVI
jgi:uncharacterized integral membrane protein